jgi:acetyl esterase/lipase
MTRIRLAAGLFLLGFVLQGTAAGQDTNVDRREDVVYGRKFGTALTMDVIRPKEGLNGRGLIWVVSGGWFSAHEFIAPTFYKPFTDRGYTVFAVVHGSQPKFTIPEIVEDMERAVRFVRSNAADYTIDPNQIGVYGASAGGHLSLMLGTAADEGNSAAPDNVDRASARVQAVACFFPPTDFLNYGKEGEIALGNGILKDFQAPFQFSELDKTRNIFVLITDEDRRHKIGKEISPFYHASSDDPPTLIIHGNADELVPIQQAEIILEKLKEQGVDTKLIVKEGAAHGWPGLEKDVEQLADWFDTHLKPSGN